AVRRRGRSTATRAGKVRRIGLARYSDSKHRHMPTAHAPVWDAPPAVVAARSGAGHEPLPPVGKSSLNDLKLHNPRPAEQPRENPRFRSWRSRAHAIIYGAININRS